MSSLRHYAVLAAAAVLLSTGSAYAGGAIARDSVGSVQVRNNSLTGGDVRNGTLGSIDVRNRSLGRADLAVGAVPRTYTFIRRVPAGTTRILTIPNFSRFDITCSPTSITMLAAFGDSDPGTVDPVQQHGLAGSDIADASPIGGATVTGPGGGVGFGSSGGASPGSGILVRGDYWGRSATQLAHGTFAWGFPSVPCLIRLQVVVQELRQPIPVSRVVPGQRRAGGITCEHTGGSAAFCVPPGD